MREDACRTGIFTHLPVQSSKLKAQGCTIRFVHFLQLTLPMATITSSVLSVLILDIPRMSS
jgi:hypothetical protein